jgi:PadR family transcriptional regulator, regulatory protein PadR
MKTKSPRLGFGTIAIMQALDQGRCFGFDLMDATGLTSGTVYPALERLEDLGFVTSRWEADAIARRDARPARRYFVLTSSGSKALAAAVERYPATRAAQRAREI